MKSKSKAAVRTALRSPQTRHLERSLAPRRKQQPNWLMTMDFLSGAIAHELRQPLSAIQNLASHLKATVTPADRSVSANLRMLEEQAEMAGQILSNLLSFARSGRPRKTAVDLHKVLESALGRIARRGEVRLKRCLARRLPRVSADALHVDRIISNLVTNGLESMEGPGTLCICTRAEPASVLLRISDTGCGIPPAHAAKIFQSRYTTKQSGTGLGLALCRQLTEANGGSLLFESRGGKGTTFELRLPRSPSPAK